MTEITTRELAEVERANASGTQPVVFVHGLWLLAGSWDAWRATFEEHGYTTLAPGWPGDPETVAEARVDPDRFSGVSVGAVTAHIAEIIGRLDRAPLLVGHSFGGLIVQKLAGMGLALATAAIDPGPFRGVLPLPFSALKAASPVIGNPANRKRAVTLTFEQFRFAFANAVPEDEAHSLYASYHVAGSGIPLFQAATANFNPRTEASVDTRNPARGPLLVISGELDHTVPHAIAHASYRRQAKNASRTEFAEIPGRGHSLVIDAGWPEVAEAVLSFFGSV